MRQAVILTPDRLSIEHVNRPSLRGDDEILLRTLACGICSGDLMPWYLAKKVGTVLGHEPIGRAVEVGKAVKHLRPGDLVFVHHHAPCQTCVDCLRGAFVHCAAWKATKLDPGGMAEFIRVGGDIVRNDAFAVNDLAPEAALFIEPLGCCVKALQRVGGVAGLRVGIVGCGIMGLLNVQTAQAFGATQVVVVEPDDVRRAAALRAGADEAWTPAEAVARAKRTLDVVVVGPGDPAVIRQALAYVRDAGALCLFAPTPTGVLTELDLGELYFREVSLVPSYSCGPNDTRRANQLLREKQVRPVEMITHRFPLDRVQEAFDVAKSGGSAIKVVVTFEESS